LQPIADQLKEIYGSYVMSTQRDSHNRTVGGTVSNHARLKEIELF
jgi:hypothetical protein